ncbi:MAG TPA: tetratricopeptide repeat protein [Thermoanaerobaculia bacterium]
MSDDTPRGPRRLSFRPKADSLQDVFRLVKRLERERAEAKEAVDRLLATTPRDRWPELSTHPDLLTSGALERLGNLFAEWLGKDPVHALEIAELAVSVAEALPEAAYPAPITVQCRAHAWKDLGKAYRAVNRYQESIDALTRAGDSIRDSGALAHDRAIVSFDLGITLQEVGRYDESLQCLGEAKEIFRIHSDTRRLVYCGIAEGVLHQRLRHFREAREIYLLLLASTKDMELESLAAIHQAIGFCSLELRDFAAAEANLEEAAALNRRLGKPVEVLKIELGRGRLLVRRGDAMLAVFHLGPIRRRFLALSMPEEAGLCGLDLVEALLSLSRFTDAEVLAKTLVREFTAAHLNTRAITALGYLTEAIGSRKASTRLVTDIREYIVSLRTEPERDFQFILPTDGSGS